MKRRGTATAFAAGMLISFSACAVQNYVAVPLGTLGGTQSLATGINANGAVTGVALLPGDTVSHAFLYSNGSMRDLGALSATASNGTAVNGSGQVVGTLDFGGGAVRHALIYSNG